MKGKKKVLLALASVAVVAFAAIGAYAYFTSTGTGTGSASVGTSTAWEVDQTAADTLSVGPLYPNTAIGTGNIQTNSYHVQNNSDGSQFLNQVDISVARGDGSAWTKCAGVATTDGSNVAFGNCLDGTYIGEPACDATDFSVGAVAVGGTWTDTALSHNYLTGVDDTAGLVTVQMIDNGLNQDNCKLAAPPLYFEAS